MSDKDDAIMADLESRFDAWINQGRALLADLKSMDDGSHAMADMIDAVAASANIETGR